MHKHQALRLTYDEAIRAFGAPIASFSIGQLVLLDEASASFQLISEADVTPTNSIVLAEVIEVSTDGKDAKLTRLRRIYKSRGDFPEGGDDDVDLGYLSKSIEERIKESDDIFKQI
jgi:hypothetical protein